MLSIAGTPRSSAVRWAMARTDCAAGSNRKKGGGLPDMGLSVTLAAGDQGMGQARHPTTASCQAAASTGAGHAITSS